MTDRTDKNSRTNEPDARILYADIIDLPHHRSLTHPPMSLYDRSAQFSPFAALTGYNEMIADASEKSTDDPTAPLS